MDTRLNDFFNSGFGWICRHCEEYGSGERIAETSRLITEGEGESKNALLSTPALAKWADPTHQVLICPNCGISERVPKS